MNAQPHRIVFLAFPQVVLLDLTGPWEVFTLANLVQQGKKLRYKLELVSGDGSKTIDSHAGLSMQAHKSASHCCGAIDTLVVPAADPDWLVNTPDHAIKTIRRLATRSRRIVSICGGAFLLAAAGLLDGKKATTHWRAVDELSARFPNVTVEPDSIYVKDGNIYSSAGVTAGIDLSLALVEEDLGRSLAMECARDLVVFMRRPGGQSQFSVSLQSQHVERNAIRDLIAWIADNPSHHLSVEAMAEHACMSVRNFSRTFRDEVGQTPAAYVERVRVEAARRHLEDSEDSLDEIALRCGFGSADSMRRSFHRVVKVAPNDYRRRFSD